MATIPVPERGSPLDVTYLYKIANAINDLSSQISATLFKYTEVKVREKAEPENMKTSDTRIVAGYIDLVNEENVLAGTTKTFSYDYTNFKYAPVAVATVVNSGQTSVGNDASVVITSITTSRVEGIVKFSSTGKMTLSVNVMLVGVPSVI